MDSLQHNAEIQDQFTRQADTFLARHGNSKDGLLELMAECAGIGTSDALLDVACGPGIVSCFFAQRVRKVTGLDTVPAMLERAKRLQTEKQLQNIEWRPGDATELPFAAESFDCVVTRFSFHHFLNPLAVLLEMRRVCRVGGTMLVADVAPREETQESFNHWEILRDPSHTCALTLTEFKTLGERASLELRRHETFSLEMDLEDLLKGSFPKPGDADRIRALFDEDIRGGQDRLGVAVRRQEDSIRLTYPVVVLAWQK
jgi:ubiquinone/menaquinone biosynthesis C-methylase UbiE